MKKGGGGKKKKFVRRRVKRVGAKRVYGGALGSKSLAPGDHLIRTGAVRLKNGRRMLVYDRAHILRTPVSIEAAELQWKPWIEDHARRAEKFFNARAKRIKSAAHIVGNYAILHVGALTLDRSRLWQPWVATEQSAFQVWRASDELRRKLEGYTAFSQIALTRATRKTGVLGWFCRARTAYYGKLHDPEKLKRKKKSNKNKERTGANAHKTKRKKKRSQRKPVRSVGRGSRTSPRRRARKHKMARGRTVRRKR